MRLDLAVIQLHPDLSRRRARAAIEKGQVTVDGVRVREPGREVVDGETVRWDPNRKALPLARCSLPILYEDDHVLVIDKPAGLLSVPSGPSGSHEDCALGRARDYVERLRPRSAYVERVHRLDRDTTGALAFALSREARAGLIRTFRDHRIGRRYKAIVAGAPREERGTVDAPLRDAWVSGRRGIARGDEPRLAARTQWRIEERFEEAALLEVTLDTGRQHQIRVHLAHVGLPILGDPVYGHPGGRRGPRPRRPMLHAWHLAFPHPVSGRQVRVTSPLPADFVRTLARLRSREGGPGRAEGGEARRRSARR